MAKFLYKDLQVMASGNYSSYELSNLFGVSENTINETLKEYGIKNAIPRYTKWTPLEDEMLISLRDKGLQIRDIAKALNRSKGMVDNRISKLGLNRRYKWEWTQKDDDNILLWKAMGLTFREMGVKMNKSKDTIAGRYYRLVKDE